MDGVLGRCSKCGTWKYTFPAILGFLNDFDQCILSLKANEQILKSITDGPNTKSALLSVKSFSITFNNQNTIRSIRRLIHIVYTMVHIRVVELIPSYDDELADRN